MEVFKNKFGKLYKIYNIKASAKFKYTFFLNGNKTNEEILEDFTE